LYDVYILVVTDGRMKMAAAPRMIFRILFMIDEERWKN
jgi:hypothetical protein